MTREEFRLKGILYAVATLVLPFIGLAAFYITPRSPLILILFYGGPVALAAVFIVMKAKEKRIPWERYQCPHCGEFFEAEPQEGKVKHLLCQGEVYIETD